MPSTEQRLEQIEMFLEDKYHFKRAGEDKPAAKKTEVKKDSKKSYMEPAKGVKR